ncbi:MAG: ATP-binding protein [Candidatus Aenigmarchaeota archaeon]|nr:ATP-binding protein [Candidatus Aenigmarchaeota archaeon]
MKILLGKNVIDKPFYWNTDKEKNSHMVVLGTSGSGKTETLKSIIHEINLNKVPSMIIDFHNEFGDLAKNVLNLREVSINPLEISGESRPENVVYEISDIIKKIFQLGEIQEAILRHAIRQSYLDYGIDLKKKGPFSDYPNFSDVEANIYRQEDSKNKTSIGSLISRIEPLFELDVFKSKTNISFKEILEETTVVELMDFPTETVKSTIAEFFLSKLSYYLYSLEKIKKLRLFCVIDEAHRLMYDNSPLNRLLRESRKYGIGVILASQRPSDFNETVLANVGGILSFQCSLDKDAKFIARQLNLEPRKVKNLIEPGLGYVKFSRKERPEKIKIILLKDRKKDEEAEKKKVKKNGEEESSKKEDKKTLPPKKEEKKKEEVEEIVDEEEVEEDSNEEEEEYEDDEDSDEEEEPEEKKKFKINIPKGMFFYKKGPIGLKGIVRIFFISMFIVFGFWSLYFMSVYSFLFFALAIIWMPYTSELLDPEKKSIGVVHILEGLLSLIIIIAFLYFF